MTYLYGDLPAVFNVREAATVLGCSERHVRTLIATGDLEHFRLGGHLIRIARHHILEVLGANGSAGPNGTDATTNTIPDVQEGTGFRGS